SVIYSGEKITVRCKIQGGGDTGWTYEWRTTSSNNPPSHSEYTISRVTESHSGDYSCKGRRDYYLTEWSQVKRLTGHCDLQPNWSVIYSGEKITVRCEIQGGGDTGWTYEWRTTSSNNPPSHSEYTISRAALSHSGDYSCRGSRDYYLTEWSRVMRLTVSSDSRVLPAGGSVTLTCSVNPSSGWKYYWYRENKLSEPLNTHDAVSQTTGTTSVSQEGLYRCRGGRGDPVYYTQFSQSVRIDTIDSKRESGLCYRTNSQP
uniref:Ig-like domain-containing protein n=1 Tax=Seriola lalandi dorsalis TaxID=1841481 RepID=A0A3B4X0D5_SERLL